MVLDTLNADDVANSKLDDPEFAGLRPGEGNDESKPAESKAETQPGPGAVVQIRGGADCNPSAYGCLAFIEEIYGDKSARLFLAVPLQGEQTRVYLRVPAGDFSLVGNPPFGTPSETPRSTQL